MTAILLDGPWTLSEIILTIIFGTLGGGAVVYAIIKQFFSKKQ